MAGSSLFQRLLGVDADTFRTLPRDRAASLLREHLADLLEFVPGERPGTTAARRADDLAAHLATAGKLDEAGSRDVRRRILTDAFLRSELDRDQNVYLGTFFTRVLTRAVPDIVFQPATPDELDAALAWARKRGIGLTVRGAGSTAMGGAVPNDGGLLLEMSRFDSVQVEEKDNVAVVGAGARMKHIHAELARQGLALKTYPSNLGGTLAGWFATGGLGLQSFKHGPVVDQVRALGVVLPRGEHVRFHDDGRLDVFGPESARLTPEEGAEWLAARGYPELRLADFARTEGQFGILVGFTVDVVPLGTPRAFWFEFDDEPEALRFVGWVADTARGRGCPPANVKYLSAEHVHAVRTVRGDATPGRAAVYVDFDDADEAARFEAGLESGKWKARNDAAEAQRWFDDRFRPQQVKRLGPGYLAAEVLLPAEHVEAFLRDARRLAERVGVHLEIETYFFGDGRALAIPGYLTQGRRRGFLFEMALAPMFVDLAMARYDGEPYVLGRWQSPFFRSKYRAAAGRRLRAAKKKVDGRWRLNPGVFFAPVFRVPFLTDTYRWTFPLGLRVLRGLYGSRLFGGLFRRLIANAPRPLPAPRTAAATAGNGARAASPEAVPGAATAAAVAAVAPTAPPAEALASQAVACVNCGECNAVCPVFHDSGIRLPQMLTHLGERAAAADRALAGTPQLLLDLCMRCGNCEEVCQAGIPHLGLYAAMEPQAGPYEGERVERHLGILAWLRHSERYLRDFLHVRPGGYLQRTPASLSGDTQFLLFRAENDAGARDTCIHCGACVPVCPTEANKQYEDAADLRRITTDLSLCVGCGTCVEVCPANLANGGRTLRVMEAPARNFFEVLREMETTGAGGDA